MDTKYAIVTTTVESSTDAAKIANALLAEGLAACVQVMPIQSYYTWQGEVNIDSEQLLIIKCKQADFVQIQQCIQANHNYELPEIVLVPISAGLPAYLQWIDEVTK
jgi:periplasmic divalent cation tolerance protein